MKLPASPPCRAARLAAWAVALLLTLGSGAARAQTPGSPPATRDPDPTRPAARTDDLAAEARATRAWAGVPAILARIVPPTFPARDFVITNYGAVGDGTRDCTAAFRDAIGACAGAGGGRVVVPPGTFLSGAIHLRSRVNLHVSPGATVLFSTNRALYLPVVFSRFECTEVMNYSPLIYALDQEDVAITGAGTLDGQGGAWHEWGRSSRSDIEKLVALGNQDVPVAQRIFGAAGRLRPNFIQPVRCRNVLIAGVKVINSPMWTLHPLYCTNVTVRGVTVDTRGPNTDGCDPDSCTDVWIKDCTFSDGDDCIAIKSGRDRDGRRVNIPCQNVVIQDCRFAAGHGGVTLGSETAGGLRQVFAENCAFDSPDLNMAMRFKTGPSRGGYIEDVYLRRCTTQTAGTGIHMTMKYPGTLTGESLPAVRRIDIRESQFANLTREAIFIEGLSAACPITDVTIAHCAFVQARKNATITNAARIRLLDTRINGALQPAAGP